MPEHVHVHAPHELTETEGGNPVSRRERVLELAAVLLLAVTTLCIAWSGYQSARWSGLQAERYAEASTARALAGRAESDADEQRLEDLVNFNRWLELSVQGDTALADLYERRFGPEFVPAFTAWAAQDPLQSPDAVPSPLLMPEYRLEDAQRSDDLEEQGDERFAEAREATEHADDYVLATVVFALVLFFAGISMRFAWPAMRVTVLALAGCSLAYGIVQLVRLPTY